MINLFTEYTPCFLILGLITTIGAFALVTVKSCPDADKGEFGWIRSHINVRTFQAISVFCCIACFFGIVVISI